MLCVIWNQKIPIIRMIIQKTKSNKMTMILPDWILFCVQQLPLIVLHFSKIQIRVRNSGYEWETSKFDIQLRSKTKKINNKNI
eukprot:UN13371